MKLISKKTQYIFSAFLLLGLLSCFPQIHLRDLSKLRTGMSPEEPPRLMGVLPREVFEWSLAESKDRIIVQSYVLSSGGEPGSTYFLAYKNGSLIFWGYPHEFARSSDPLIREIGKGAISRYDKSRYYP